MQGELKGQKAGGRLGHKVVAALLMGTALGSITVTVPAPAQAQTAQQRTFAIRPQPLPSALTVFGQQTGLQVSVDAAAARGLTSPGATGIMTPAVALHRLLDGTGLSYRFTGASTVVIGTPGAQAGGANVAGAISLDTIDVQGASSSDPGKTEGTGSYTPTSTNTAAKLNLTPRETPQTVTVVTNQQMRDFGMTSVDDALKTISGVFVGDRGNNGGAYFSRGFLLQSQYDGMPNPVGISTSNNNPQIDNAFLDRVEVLQGAAGLLTGAGDPGGTVNLVRKRPTTFFQAQAEAQVASWNGRRIVGDVSGPLTANGSVRGRLVAVADNSDSFVNYAYRNRRAIYGVVEADLTDTTMLEASVQYQRDVGRNHFGAPFAADGSESGISRSAFFADGRSRTTKDYTLTTLGLTQQLAGGWQAKAKFTYGKTHSNVFRYSSILSDLDLTTGDGVTMSRDRNFTKDSNFTAVDVYASGPFQLFGRQHEATFGVNGSSWNQFYQGSGTGEIIPINAYTFDPMSLGDVPEGGTPYSGGSKTTQMGAYGVGRFSLTNSLKFIAGTRVSNYKEKDALTGLTYTTESGVVSPYAGLTYDLNSQYSIYASYTDIFKPQSNRSVNGGTVKPVVGSNYEVGIKGELLNKRLNVSAALFRLEQTNLPRLDESVLPDPSNVCGGACYIAADKVISQGIDLGVSGELSPGWQVMAGYTFTDSKYATGVDNGKRFGTYLPQHSFRLASAYKLPGTDWTVGGSLSARSETYINGLDWQTGQPMNLYSGPLVLVGLMAKYEINRNAELTMMVSNLFDRTYRVYLETKHYSTYGDPRKFTVNLRYKF